MNRIDALFTRLRTRSRRALMPFVTAGDPDLPTTAVLIHELVRRGAHLIEVGIPYSDPIADGPVIAASYHRALERGVKIGAHLPDACAPSAPRGRRGSTTRRWSRWSRTRSSTGSGVERYLNDAATAGLDGLIVPDLPVEESRALMEKATAAQPQADPAHHPDHAPRARRRDRPPDDRVHLLRLGRRHHRRAQEPAARSGRTSPGCGPRPTCRSASASASAPPSRSANSRRSPTA